MRSLPVLYQQCLGTMPSVLVDNGLALPVEHLPLVADLPDVNRALENRVERASIPERHNASHPHALGGSDLVADPLAGDFPLELREGQQQVQREPPHGAGGVELLGVMNRFVDQFSVNNALLTLRA